MKCAHCGSQIQPGMIRCRQCGEYVDQRAHESLVAEEDPSNSANSSETASSGSNESVVPVYENSHFRKLFGRLKVQWLVITVLGGFAVLLVVGAIFWTTQPRPTEFDYELTSATDGLISVQSIKNGRYIVAGSTSGTAVVWEIPEDSAKTLETLTTQPLTSLAISSDGFLLAGGPQRELVGWQIYGRGAGERTTHVTGFEAPITCLAVHPQRFNVVIGVSSGSLYFFSAGAETRRFDSGHKAGVKTVLFSPDGRMLITGGTDGQLIWHAPNGDKQLHTLEAHESEVSGLTFSKDGQLLISGDLNGEIKVFDAATRKQKSSLSQPDAISGMAWANKYLVTGSWDGRLRFWSLDDSKIVTEFDTGDIIHDLSVNSEGSRAVTVSGGKTVQVWKVPRD